MSKLATRTIDMPEADLAVALRQGIDDPDAEVRKRALAAVASRVGAPRFGDAPEVLSRWEKEAPGLGQLRPLVIRRLKDTDATVRDAAVMALGNFDVDKSTTSTNMTLRPDTVAVLAAHYASESDPRVRGNIVKGLALSKNDSEPLRTFLINAVDDSSAEVRQFAARGIVRAPGAVALPKLARLLSDSDRAVRFTAAQSIGRFGAAASEYQQALATAASTEKDQSVKDEIERALTAITTPAKQ